MLTFCGIPNYTPRYPARYLVSKRNNEGTSWNVHFFPIEIGQVLPDIDTASLPFKRQRMMQCADSYNMKSPGHMTVCEIHLDTLETFLLHLFLYSDNGIGPQLCQLLLAYVSIK